MMDLNCYRTASRRPFGENESDEHLAVLRRDLSDLRGDVGRLGRELMDEMRSILGASSGHAAGGGDSDAKAKDAASEQAGLIENYKKMVEAIHLADEHERKASKQHREVTEDAEGHSKSGDPLTHRLMCALPSEAVQSNCTSEYSNSEKPSAFMEKLSAFVGSGQFDALSGMVVLLNSITMGVQTDYMARHLLLESPRPYRIVELIFCFIFTVELCLRVAVYRLQFLTGSGFLWNWFDTVLVGMQLVEELMTSILTMDSVTINMSFMRVLRILRLIRILRIVRLLRLIRELRTIVASIMGSLKSLGWTVVLLFLLVYIMGVCFTQVVLDYRLQLPPNWEDTSDDLDLQGFFGDLTSSLVVLYQSVSGGVNWSSLFSPLIIRVGTWAGVVLLFFIMFTSLALLNVVTGVFVEAAVQSAKNDQDSYLINHMRKFFAAADRDGTGMITWEGFEQELNQPAMQEFFQSINVDTSEARGVFHLLDVDESGTIELEEFLSGVMGLHGPARALDVATLMWEMRQLTKLYTSSSATTTRYLSSIIAVLPGATSLVEYAEAQDEEISNAANLVEAKKSKNPFSKESKAAKGYICSCGAKVPDDAKVCKNCGKRSGGGRISFGRVETSRSHARDHHSESSGTEFRTTAYEGEIGTLHPEADIPIIIADSPRSGQAVQSTGNECNSENEPERCQVQSSKFLKL